MNDSQKAPILQQSEGHDPPNFGLTKFTDEDIPVVSACSAIPINDKATRYKGGGPTRKGDGSGNGLGIGKDGDPSPTITTGDRHAVAVDCRNLRETEELSGTLQAKENGSYSLNYQNPVRTGFTVRRLTPTEAERLMGFDDGWTAFGHDGKPISDSRRYMLLGNSIAVPCAAYIMQGIVDAVNNGFAPDSSAIRGEPVQREGEHREAA